MDGSIRTNAYGREVRRNSMLKAIIGFVAGAVLSAAFFNFTVLPNMRAQSTQATQAAQMEQRQAGDMQKQVQNLQNQLQTVTTDRDACKAKFERATILYDSGLFGETRAWVIPADVEPKTVGVKRGSFSHYDPKGQTETVHFEPTAAH
jgi:hypothetical protein